MDNNHQNLRCRHHHRPYLHYYQYHQHQYPNSLSRLMGRHLMYQLHHHYHHLYPHCSQCHLSLYQSTRLHQVETHHQHPQHHHHHHHHHKRLQHHHRRCQVDLSLHHLGSCRYYRKHHLDPYRSAV